MTSRKKKPVVPVTIYISRRDLIPPWFDKYLRAHLKIHRPHWRVKSKTAQKFGVSIVAVMASKRWMEDMEAYITQWVEWARAKDKKSSNPLSPPIVKMPSEFPPQVVRGVDL
jgi:hypothetical protein